MDEGDEDGEEGPSLGEGEGEGEGEGAVRVGETRARARYARRDAGERREVARTAPAGSEALFMAAVSAKCAEAPDGLGGGQAGEDGMRSRRLSSGSAESRAAAGTGAGFVGEVVRAWREKTRAEAVARGGSLAEGSASQDASEHVCSGDTCTYHVVRDVFICEGTGRVHVCGAKCARDMARRRAKGHACSGVCRVSGRVLPSAAFIHAHEEESAVVEEAHEADEPSGPRANHYHSFSFGYFARDERELASLGAPA